MSRYTILLIILIILLPCACRRTNESKRSDFLRFEQLMPGNPDSVLSSLQTIDPEQLSRGEQAWYYLLKTEAEDKLYRDHTTDSLIAFARDYYASTGDIPRLAKAFYLSGRIHTDWKEWERATEEFLKAKELTEESRDWGLKGRIEEYLGYVSWKNDLDETALSYYKQAYSYYLRTNNNVDIAYALKGMGNAWGSLKQMDSTFLTLEKALKVAEKTDEWQLKAELYRRIGFLYREKRNYKTSEEYTRKAIAISIDVPVLYYTDLCDLFLETNQYDSIYIYAQKVLASNPDLRSKCLVNYYLSEWAQNVGCLEDAIQYRKKYETLSDSIKHQKNTELVGKRQHKYIQDRLVDKHIESNSVKIFLILVILLISAFGITYLIKYIRKERAKNLKSESRVQELLDVIHKNEEQIAYLQAKEIENAQKEAIIEQLKENNQEILKKINAINIARCQKHINLRKLYSKRILCERYTEAMWQKLVDDFESVYPNFESNLKQAFPAIPETLLRICILSIMDIKTERIATILGLQPSTVSSHKQAIKKRYFATERKAPLEEFLLKYVI